MSKNYEEKIIELIKLVQQDQSESIKHAAKSIADSIKRGGVLHIVGCGHSHMLVEEVFYRAGGLAPINPIFDTSIMLHEGAVKSSAMERMNGLAKPILDNYELEAGEYIIIISNSGINSVPVEMAMEAKKRGLSVIALTSSANFQAQSRHSSGKKLYELADIVIDNHAPYGDAIIDVPEKNYKMAPCSTILGAFILNTLVIEVVEQLARNKVDPPVFISGNIEGGSEKSQKLIQQYRQRIKHF